MAGPRVGITTTNGILRNRLRLDDLKIGRAGVYASACQTMTRFVEMSFTLQRADIDE